MSALVLNTVGNDDVERSVPMSDEEVGRTGWLVAVADPSIRYAALVRTAGPWRERYRCEWSARGTFRDITEAHEREIAALCTGLLAEAPSGHVITLRGPLRERRVVMNGSRGQHSLDVACSSAERVRAHWRGFLPVRSL